MTYENMGWVFLAGLIIIYGGYLWYIFNDLQKGK
jgi:hypothetical protein